MLSTGDGVEKDETQAKKFETVATALESVQKDSEVLRG